MYLQILIRFWRNKAARNNMPNACIYLLFSKLIHNLGIAFSNSNLLLLCRLLLSLYTAGELENNLIYKAFESSVCICVSL